MIVQHKLAQPWYFSILFDIAVDDDDNVYVADTDNHRIQKQKFSPDGNFIKKWGSYGTGDGEFDRPFGILLDNSGNVYVTDSGNITDNMGISIPKAVFMGNYYSLSLDYDTSMSNPFAQYWTLKISSVNQVNQ